MTQHRSHSNLEAGLISEFRAAVLQHLSSFPVAHCCNSESHVRIRQRTLPCEPPISTVPVTSTKQFKNHNKQTRKKKMRLGTQPGLITQYMLTNQDPTLTASEQWSRDGRYLGSSRFGVESRLQYLYLPEPQFPHPKNGSNKTHLTKLGQDPGHRDNFLTFKIPAKHTPTDLGGKKTANESTTRRDTGTF